MRIALNPEEAMSQIIEERRAAQPAALVAAVLLLATACGNAPPHGAGLVDESWYRGRQAEYLRYATESLSAGSPLNVIANMEREVVDPDWVAPIGVVGPDTWADAYEKMRTLEDTRDFDALYLLNVLLGYRDHPMLAPGTVERLEAELLGFKLWFTEPTPEGLIDNSYYWTENHQLIYWTIEYLLGQEYPEASLSTDRRSGAEHLVTARARILRWLEHRAHFGFSEWHSNVYYQKDLTPLLTLVEYADDPEIVTRASMVLDVLLYDMAVHTHRGSFGSTHGRSYKKDKMSSFGDDTWGGVKLLFDTTALGWASRSAPDAVLLSRARVYRMPEVLRRIARYPGTFTERERMSLPIDLDGPYEPDPPAPYGFDFDDPANLDVWWGIGALTAWPVVPLTLRTMEEHNLWETTNFAPFADLRVFASIPDIAQRFAADVYRFLTFGVLDQVNTLTHRTADYMLSTAVDYNPGSFRSQIHTWQATIDPDALVFVNHPFRPNPESLDWSDRGNEQGGYWTGEASVPRSAQHENVGIHIYAPQYARRNPAPFTFFRYQDYTHAFVPQDHFDEVIKEGGWVFVRKGTGYVALWSWRPTRWQEWDPAIYATNGMLKPFDLIADGGADDVWIVECGSEADWGSFARFRAAIAAAPVEVVPLGERAESGISPGFDVVYVSPSQGRLEFGWTRPFTVEGKDVPLGDFARIDGPFARQQFDGTSLHIEHDGAFLDLDFARGLRAPGGG